MAVFETGYKQIGKKDEALSVRKEGGIVWATEKEEFSER